MYVLTDPSNVLKIFHIIRLSFTLTWFIYIRFDFTITCNIIFLFIFLIIRFFVTIISFKIFKTEILVLSIQFTFCTHICTDNPISLLILISCDDSIFVYKDSFPFWLLQKMKNLLYFRHNIEIKFDVCSDYLALRESANGQLSQIFCGV